MLVKSGVEKPRLTCSSHFTEGRENQVRKLCSVATYTQNQHSFSKQASKQANKQAGASFEVHTVRLFFSCCRSGTASVCTCVQCTHQPVPPFFISWVQACTYVRTAILLYIQYLDIRNNSKFDGWRSSSLSPLQSSAARSIDTHRPPTRNAIVKVTKLQPAYPPNLPTYLPATRTKHSHVRVTSFVFLRQKPFLFLLYHARRHFLKKLSKSLKTPHRYFPNAPSQSRDWTFLGRK